MKYIEVVPNYKVIFTGSPEGITFKVGSALYAKNQVASYPDGTYPYVAQVAGDNSYGSIHGSFTVSGGDIIISETLTRRNYILKVYVDSYYGKRLEDTSIYINDKLIGKTDKDGSITYSVGEGSSFNVIGRKKGFFPSAITVNDMDSDKTINLIITQDTGSANVYNGVLSATSSPSGAKVYINGKYEGITPMTKLYGENTYSYSIVKEGYQDYTGNFRVTSGTVSNLSGMLTPIQVESSIKFTSNVASVEVSDSTTGEILGYTPFTKSMPIGTYNISAKKDGYDIYRGNLIVREGGEQGFGIVMKESSYFPAKGVLVETYCRGFDKYGKFHDGQGGFYDELVEKDCIACGFPTKPVVNIEDDVQNSLIYIYKNGVNPPHIGESSTSLTTPFLLLDKKWSNSIECELPVGDYTVVSVPKTDTILPALRIAKDKVSSTGKLTINSTLQKYYVKLINYKDTKNSAKVSVTLSIKNGVLYDYLATETQGNMGWSIVSFGKELSINSFINLIDISNPESSNGTHSMDIKVDYEKKYTPIRVYDSTARTRWKFSNITKIIPQGVNAIDAQVVDATKRVIVTEANNATCPNMNKSSVSFSYLTSRNSSSITVLFEFEATWWESV